MTVVLGRVALTTNRALPAGPSGESDPATRLYAKNGLVVASDSTFQLVVPRAWRSRVAIGWGSGAPHVARFVIPRCDGGGAAWLAFAGGYWARDRACVPLLVQARHRTVRVHVGVGAACPGQQPPPPPLRPS
jgi:hypothetical protein